MACGCASSPPVAPVISTPTAAVFSGGAVQFAASVNGKPATNLIWYVNGIAGGSATTGTISTSGLYTAPTVTSPASFLVNASRQVGMGFSQVSVVTVLAGGAVASTQNPLVANYAFPAPVGATVQIQFGTDTNYGRTTWAQSAPTGGGAVNILVAGMLANTLYHMRAQVTLADGTMIMDSDHTFTTGSLPVSQLPTLAASTSPGASPQSGVELLDLADSTIPNAVLAMVLDLNGNVIWYYYTALPFGNPTLSPIKLLPNGHFLLSYNDIATGPVDAQDGVQSLLQEVDLAGNVVWQMTNIDLDNALAAATCAGCNVNVLITHHDFALLPNGHLIVLGQVSKFFSNLTGYPNGINVIGDVIIDLDQNRNPAWIWSTFDHLDPNRALMGLPDWTHSNAIVYSPTDGNLVLSMRNQSWVIKIDYNNGQGTGNILWTLGYQGNLTLLNGTSPIDWQYAQHDFNFISPTSAGAFDAALFDDGNLRVLDDNGDVCGTTTPCYSRAVIFHIDETAMTATLQWFDAPNEYSYFGGSTRVLPNGNVEFDECAGPGPGANAAIFEVTQTTPPQPVWQLQVLNQYSYRSFRIPSLYPGVQW
jgi:arylsulfate sulfotransferase